MGNKAHQQWMKDNGMLKDEPPDEKIEFGTIEPKKKMVTKLPPKKPNLYKKYGEEQKVTKLTMDFKRRLMASPVLKTRFEKLKGEKASQWSSEHKKVFRYILGKPAEKKPELKSTYAPFEIDEAGYYEIKKNLEKSIFNEHIEPQDVKMMMDHFSEFEKDITHQE